MATGAELVAQSKLMSSSEPEEAIKKALSAIDLYKKAKDKKGESEALDAAVSAYLALPDTYEALLLAKASLRAKKAIGDGAGEASVGLQLAEMQLDMKSFGEALTYAENAMSKYQELKDTAGKANVNEVISKIYCAMGEPEKAPNRSQAEYMLRQLKLSIENNDTLKFHKTLDALKTMPAVTPTDIEDTLGAQLAENYLPTAKFLKDTMGLDDLVQKENAIVVPKTYHYFGFRAFGGLGYGPAFRYTNQIACFPNRGDYSQMHTLNCIQVSEDRDNWEHELAYNHGVLDGMLQSGFSASLIGPNGERGYTAMGKK